MNINSKLVIRKIVDEVFSVDFIYNLAGILQKPDEDSRKNCLETEIEPGKRQANTSLNKK